MEDTYTLADLERITGAKRRSLQLWSDAGVIIAEPVTMRAGSGVHRRFSKDEAIVACAVSAFADLPMSIGGLKMVSEALREALSSRKYRKMIDDAVAGKGQCYIVSERWGDESWEVSIVGGREPPTTSAQLAKSFIAALAASASHLSKPRGRAFIILLNTYIKGLMA